MKNQSKEPSSPLSTDPLIQRHLASHRNIDIGVGIALAMSFASLILSALVYLLKG